MPNVPEVSPHDVELEKTAIEALAKTVAEATPTTRAKVEEVLTLKPAEATGINTFLGENSSEPLKGVGELNVAYGAKALAKITEGGTNTAIGYEASTLITTGGGNTTLGYKAGSNLTTGKESTAIGEKALEESKTGVQNVAVGTAALKATTGEKNTALGNGAGSAIEAGTKNVHIGCSTSGAATATNDVVIGSEAKSSSEGVSIGFKAGKGGTNVTIGYESGTTSEGGNVMLGYKAGKGKAVANTLVIANNETTPLIEGVLSGTQKLGFYGVTPVSKAAEIKVPGAYKIGVAAFETEAEAKAIRDKLTAVIEALKGIGICV